MVARTRSGTSSRSSNNNSATKSGNRLVTTSTTGSTSSGKSGNSKYSRQALPPAEQDARPHFSEYPKIDQALVTMKASLGRFTRANDRRMVLRTLKDVKYLKALPIEGRPPPMVDLEELEMEVAKENLVLNGQAFHRKTKYGRTSTDFLHVLHELCYQLCENASSPSVGVVMSGNASVQSQSMVSSLAMALSPDTLYYDLLCRLARTITSADCFAKLNDILGSHELILMNSSSERKPKIKKNKGMIMPNEMGALPPIEVNIFEEGGNIHAHIVTTLGYGLYRKLDVNTGRPWIKLQVELNERTNFTSGSQVRHITCIWPDMYV